MITVKVDLSPTANAPLGFKPCRRCKQTPGFVQSRTVHLGVPGLCFECDGKGKIRIPTEADKAHAAFLADIQDRYLRIAPALREAIDALPDHRQRGDARNGLSRLRTCDHLSRFTKMLDAIDAGRLDAVVQHLIVFWHEVREAA